MTPSTPPTLLSSEDFPALAPSTSDAMSVTQVVESPIQEISVITNSKSQEKADRKAAKKTAAVEKANERQRVALEKAEAKAAEKAKLARDKAAEKERALILKAQQTLFQSDAEKVEALDTPPEATPVRLDKSKNIREKPTIVKSSVTKKNGVKGSDTATTKRQEQSTSTRPISRTDSLPQIRIPVAEAATQVPLLSKKPKKNKPITKFPKVPTKEESSHEASAPPSATETSRQNAFTADSTPSNSRSHSVDRHHSPTSVQELLQQIDAINPALDLSESPFFDVQRLSSPVKMPLEYGPLVHALSALSVGGGSFANNMPSGSIDNAVSSFQQLLETLTQTISDLLRLLPRTTWDDSSSFDGVLRDMLKGDDFLDDGEETPGKDDEVAALTLALERRARWMEVQLSKLEELHRDINTAAVRAVLSFNDGGWDRHGFLPRVGNTLHRFDGIGMIGQIGEARPMTADELEKKLAVAKEAAIFAEAEIREAMQKFHIPKQ